MPRRSGEKAYIQNGEKVTVRLRPAVTFYFAQDGCADGNEERLKIHSVENFA